MLVRRGQSKAGLLREQLRLRSSLERSFRPRIREALKEAVADAAAAFQNQAPIEATLPDHRQRVDRLLRAHYNDTLERFGERFFDQARAGPGPTETKQNEEFERLIQEWIAAHAARKVTQITQTTREQIRDAIARGEADGLGVEAIARMLREDTGDRIGRIRSRVIARTETHSASNAANDIAARSLQLPALQKEWLAVDDPRTRPTHNAADGQTVPEDQPFIVGGAELQYPGDPAAPPRETVQCRCTTSYLIPDER